jgi:hypothetical protein
MKALIATVAVLLILAWIIWPGGDNPHDDQMFI